MNANAEVVMSPRQRPFCWIKPEDLDEAACSSRNILAKRPLWPPVFLENDFALRWFADKYPDVELEENSKPIHNNRIRKIGGPFSLYGLMGNASKNVDK